MLRALAPSVAFAGGSRCEALGRSGRACGSPTRACVRLRRRGASARRRRAHVFSGSVSTSGPAARPISSTRERREGWRPAARTELTLRTSDVTDGPGISPGHGPSLRGMGSSRVCPRDVLSQRAAKRRESSRSEHMRSGDPARVSWIHPRPGPRSRAGERSRLTAWSWSDRSRPGAVPRERGRLRATGHLGAPVA